MIRDVRAEPGGACYDVKDQTSRTFHLFLPALQNGRSQFVINGNWKISIPGEYNVAGTKLLYRRSADTWESFEVPGPTREDLHLMVRLQAKSSLCCPPVDVLLLIIRCFTCKVGKLGVRYV